jgi:WD40 repeat protein
MSPFYRLILALVMIAFMTVGCQTSATPTITPAANTPISPISTLGPVTNTLVSPTNTPIPATATPLPPTAILFPTDIAPAFAANAIAFFAFNPSNQTSEIMVIQADGNNPQSIPGMSGAATFSWSPDRKRLVYIVHYGDSDWSMYVIGADGKNKVRLTQGDLDYNPTWSPDGAQIAFSRNGNLWVMRVSNAPQPVVSDLRQLTTDPKQLVWKIAWSPDGKQIAFDSQMGDPKGTASYNDPSTTEIYLINADGSNLRQLTDNQFIDAGPSWSPDGKNIVFFSNRDGDPNYTMKKAFSAKSDGAFQLYSMAADGQNVQRLTNTTANDMQPDWSPDGKQIAFSSNRDGNYEIYVMNADGSGATRLTESPTQDGSPAWLPYTDFERVAISLSNVDQIEALATLAGHKDGVTGLVFLPDAAHLASLSGDLVLTLWDIKSNQKVNTLTEPGARVYNVAFSPNGELLAVGNPDNTIGVWDVKNGQLLQTFSKRKSFVMKVAFSADSSLLATGGAEGEISVWDVTSGQELYTLQAPNSPIGSLAFSPNGTLLASGNAEGNTDITLWDMESKQALRTLSGHRGNVYNLVFTPNGKQFISSSGDLTIKVWDIESGQEIRTLRGHSGYVYGLALSPDGSLLASASADGLIKLWDAKSGKELRTLDSHDEYIYFLAFSPDGALLASSVNKGQAIILWGLKP